MAHQWLLDPARVAAAVQGKRVDVQLLTDIERVVEARRGMDDAIGGGGLIRALREDLRIVTGLLSNSSYTEELGSRLHVAAAELSRLAGYQAVKAGQNAAYLHSRRARAAACCGDPATWDCSQGLSFDLLAQSRPENEPAWLYWLGEAFLHGDAGAGALELGRAKDAERHNRLAVATLKPELEMDRMEYLAQLARARVAIGEVEHACQAAVQAAVAVRRQDSAYTRQQLTRFRADIAPHASRSAVQEFDAKFTDLLSV